MWSRSSLILNPAEISSNITFGGLEKSGNRVRIKKFTSKNQDKENNSLKKKKPPHYGT